MRVKTILFTLILFTMFTMKNIEMNAAINLKRSYENFTTYLMDGFSVKDSWKIKFSRFRVHNWDTDKSNYQPSATFMRWKKIEKGPRARFMLPPYPREQYDDMEKRYGEKSIYNILGVRAKFMVYGYNWVVLEPRKELFLKGLARVISIWVWGGNYRYKISIFVKDYRGGIYEIPGGKINFVGWKLVRFIIPSTIPQRDVHLPANKYLQFLRIKFISEFSETPDKFYVWLASMWAEVDLYKDRFYGEGLLNEPNW